MPDIKLIVYVIKSYCICNSCSEMSFNARVVANVDIHKN